MNKIRLNYLSFDLAGIFFVIALIVQLYLIFSMFNINMINYYFIFTAFLLLALQYSLLHRFSVGTVNNICIKDDFLYIDYVKHFKHDVFKIELNKIESLLVNVTKYFYPRGSVFEIEFIIREIDSNKEFSIKTEMRYCLQELELIKSNLSRINNFSFSYNEK